MMKKQREKSNRKSEENAIENVKREEKEKE